MARYLFNGNVSVASSRGKFPVFSDQALLTQVTDLLDEDGSTAVTQVTRERDFYGPDGVTVLWGNPSNDPDNPPVQFIATDAPAAVSSGGSSPVLTAFYSDEAMGAGDPVLTVDAQPWPSTADGVICEVDATTHNQVNILVDCTLSVTAQGYMYNTGTDGGSVTLRLVRGEDINLSWDQDTGGNPGDAGEVDACVTLSNLPLIAGDYIKITLAPHGADNTGNVCTLLINATPTAA